MSSRIEQINMLHSAVFANTYVQDMLRIAREVKSQYAVKEYPALHDKAVELIILLDDMSRDSQLVLFNVQIELGMNDRGWTAAMDEKVAALKQRTPPDSSER